MLKWFDRTFGKTPEEGGRLVIDAAVVKGAETLGKFLSEAKLLGESGHWGSPTLLSPKLPLKILYRVFSGSELTK